MQESMRYYCTEDGRRYNAVVKVAHKGKAPEFVWSDEEDPDKIYTHEEGGRLKELNKEMYKSPQFNDMFSDGEQIIFPDMGRMLHAIQSSRMLPSVTSMELFTDHGLQLWKQGNVAQAAIEEISRYYQENNHLPDPEHDYWLGVKSKAMSLASPDDASERGKRWHGAIEMALSGQDPFQLEDQEIPVFERAFAKIKEYMAGIEGHPVEMERFFVNTEYGYAGTADIRKGSHVLDVKTSDKPLFGKKGGLLKANWIFDDRPRQLAAYAIGLEIEEPILTNCFIRIPGPKCPPEEAGDVHFHTYTKETTDRNILLWKHYVQVWYLKNMRDDELWRNRTQ